ncbi:MAG: hypothetical protein ABSF99_07735 [Anaerolineales bacterium]|jgi:uncharacterized membrane protein YphA (DoxX/SURF4 family)
MKLFLKSEDAKMDRLGQIGLLISRMLIGILWFTQLLWKLPPTFGCPANFAVSTSITARTTGLCDWVGLMSIYSLIPLQGSLVKSLVIPNLAWMGWLIFLMEAFVAISLILGLFTRLGGLVGLLQAMNLFFGVSAVPGEWYWSYLMLAILGLIFLAVPTGRSVGFDTWLRPRLQAGAGKGNWLAKILLALT